MARNGKKCTWNGTKWQKKLSGRKSFRFSLLTVALWHRAHSPAAKTDSSVSASFVGAVWETFVGNLLTHLSHLSNTCTGRALQGVSRGKRYKTQARSVKVRFRVDSIAVPVFAVWLNLTNTVSEWIRDEVPYLLVPGISHAAFSTPHIHQNLLNIN